MRLPVAGVRSATLALACVLAAFLVAPLVVPPLESATTSVGVVRAPDSLPYRDPIARLQARIDSGTVTLTHDSAHGYLASLMRALKMPVSSQGLVFSRTSLQTDKIAPWTPRALYFSDDVYIGFVQESSFLEVAAMDPVRGAVFYTLSQEPRGRPTFSRETTTCLMCHQSRSATGGVPGLMVLSTIADRFGYPIVGVHEGSTTDATPVHQRFGGWYVTGTHGDSAVGGHSGNIHSPKLAHEVSNKQQYKTQIDLSKGGARRDLSDKFDPTPYLSTQSDIVAMMVLVHQTVVHNLFTTVHEAVAEAQVAGAMPSIDAAWLASPSTASPKVPAVNTAAVAPSAIKLGGAVDRLVKALLFVDEAPLRGAMRGTTSFTDDFAQLGPRDHLGRSLRDFDLSARLFKYPLSFLIYSEGFSALPKSVRHEIYRLVDVALRDGGEAAATSVSAAERRAIVDILSETSPDFRAFQAASGPRPN